MAGRLKNGCLEAVAARAIGSWSRSTPGSALGQHQREGEGENIGEGMKVKVRVRVRLVYNPNPNRMPLPISRDHRPT